jgi:Kef-type K+ transport system membrane component KefB
MTGEQTAQMLTALAVLLVAVNVLGNAFVRMRQPRVIGEFVAGLLLGPTLLSGLFPEQLAWIFPDSGPVAAVLDAVYQLGLLLLMYCSGAEIRLLFGRGERRTIVGVILGGILVPFLLGLLLVSIIDTRTLRGPNADPESFALVFGIAIAITSIPVISRILFDLGVIGTSFSRIVLGAAVAEDVVLYVALAVALGLAESNQSSPFGFPAVLSSDPTSGWNIAYHLTAETAFLAIAVLLGPRLLRRALSVRPNPLGWGDPLALQLAFMFAVSALCVVLGIAPMLGAFVGGIIAGTAKSEAVIQSRESIKRFSFAFFVPCYFALVGFQLDLLHDFDLLFFAGFLFFATAVKGASVYAGARLAGERHPTAVNLAAAMNARGGPGIVLASTAFGAGIVSRSFFASLVMLSVVTSVLAGIWLDRIVRSGRPLREERSADGSNEARAEPTATLRLRDP